MIDYLNYLAETQLQEYYQFWKGHIPGTWKPVDEYSYRCYDRHQRLIALILFLDPDYYTRRNQED